MAACTSGVVEGKETGVLVCVGMGVRLGVGVRLDVGVTLDVGLTLGLGVTLGDGTPVVGGCVGVASGVALAGAGEVACTMMDPAAVGLAASSLAALLSTLWFACAGPPPHRIQPPLPISRKASTKPATKMGAAVRWLIALPSYISHSASPKNSPWSRLTKASTSARMSPRRKLGPCPG